MEAYHKIQTLFKRHLDGPKKGKMIRGQWTTPALEYLSKNRWEFTEKVDGTNIRIEWAYPAGKRAKEVKFGGRTDNAVIPVPLLAHLNETFDTDLFEKAFPEADSNPITLFGEGYGPKIQNGGLYREDQSFVLFDVKIGPWWLTRDSVNDIARKMKIEHVPVIGYGTLEEAIDIVSTGLTFESSGAAHLWGPKRLNSQWGNFEAEGIVARPEVPLFDRGGSRIITKIKAVDFR